MASDPAEATTGTDAPAEVPSAFGWRELLFLYSGALLSCAAGSILSYNGLLTSNAWHSWIIERCSTSGTSNGSYNGPVIDIVRAALAAAPALFAFHRMAIVPTGSAKGEDRRLNWLPWTRKGLDGELPSDEFPFAKHSRFEPALLLAFAVPAATIILIARPYEFLLEYRYGDYSGSFDPIHFFNLLPELYSTSFFDITRPYIFPYSLYILGLWYFMALPVLICIIRSIRFDFDSYRDKERHLASPAFEEGTTPAGNAIDDSRFEFTKAFTLIDDLGKRYASILAAMILLCYLEQLRLTCSVLQGASDEGKTALLLISASSVGALCYSYLFAHYRIRSAASRRLDALASILRKDPTRGDDLRDCSELLMFVKSKDGVKELWTFGGFAGAFGLIYGFLWNISLTKTFAALR